MKNKIKNLRCYERVVVSIAYFLYNYCGISDERAHKMTHSDLKKLMSNLQRVSFDDAIDNPHLVYAGDIVLIRDAKKNIVPYISPFKEIEDFKSIYSPEGIAKKPKTNRRLTTFLDVANLSNYELKLNLKLQKNSHNISRFKFCRLLKREIKSRGIQGSGKKRILIDMERGKENV